ncbi:MAG TPA: hypothetical protein VLX61_01885 [Anaerolineales bacterium]|nr:hypothetical protein [Anaerolineales bacterium]
MNKIKSPFEVQEFLLTMPYNAEERNRSPLNVILDKQCHCLDGAFLAALLLWKLGFEPLVLDLVPAPDMDDDHVLALYQYEDRWGAVAKSNYVNLGFREAVYKNLRELAMTYFEHFISIYRVKTLRGYMRPFDLSKFPLKDWSWNEESTTKLYKRFYSRKVIPLIRGKMERRLSLVSDRNYTAEIMYTDLKESFGNRPE